MAHGPALTVLLTADQVRDKVRERAAALNTGYPVGWDPHEALVLNGASSVSPTSPSWIRTMSTWPSETPTF